MKYKLVGIFILVLLFFIIGVKSSFAATYYVSPSGNDSYGGSLASPWKTLTHAANIAVSGDIVYIRTGTYHEVLAPIVSGAQSSPITFKAYQGETPIISGVNSGGSPPNVTGLATGINLANKSYIVVDGLIVRDVYDHWADLTNANNNTLQNMTFTFSTQYGTGNWQGILMDGSSFNKILNSTIEKWGCPQDVYNCGGDAINMKGGAYNNLIQGNTFGSAMHAEVQIQSGHDNIIRQNTFTNDIEKDLEITDRVQNTTYHNLIELNTFRQAGWNNENHGGMHIQMASSRNIIRNNIFTDSSGEAMNCEVWSDSGDIVYDCANNRVYNNTIVHTMIDPGGYPNGAGGSNQNWIPGGLYIDNFGYGMYPITGNVFKNNIFYDNQPNTGIDPGDDQIWILDSKISLDSNLFQGNIFFHQNASDHTIHVQGVISGTAIEANNNLSGNFSGNLATAPTFITYAPATIPETYDLHLRSGSAGIDQGANLTQTTASGNGTAISVADASYFQDGYLGMITADSIRVGNSAAIISSVDLVNNIINVDRSLSWQSGDAVNLLYAGSAPDIGVYEYGTITIYPADQPSGNDNPTQNNSSTSSITSSANSNYCSDTKPAKKVDLFEIDRAGSTAILYFTPSDKNTRRYNVIFGFKENDERFGGIGIYSQNNNEGVQNIKIDHLDRNTSYSFKIIPINGCAFGEWSNWLTTKGSQNSSGILWKTYKYLRKILKT
ncbi:MAG TPA: right-handed parallel beta-helix repeat-containing protein [Patescibacteria group bacterium]|nr:right-handed parallel beta-helix repeat-containing protein [Patescibacteria group bacterium]